MKILITNDDGVQAAQLPGLIRWAKKLGEVTVVVPKVEQSAKSHSISIKEPMQIRQILLNGEFPVWTVDSTPADCVRFAAVYLKEQYDLVISGVNRGYNIGQDMLYSGTLAAASEAANKGWPSLALSTSIKYYDHATDHLDLIYDYLLSRNLWQKHPIYNVNIPGDPTGIRITRQGEESFHEEFIPMGNDMFLPGGKPIRSRDDDLTKDTAAVAHGYISVTPITTNRTDLAVFAALSQE